jgi:hypothetical protein
LNHFNLLPYPITHEKLHGHSIDLQRFQIRRRDPRIHQRNLPRPLAPGLPTNQHTKLIITTALRGTHDPPPRLDILHHRLRTPKLSALAHDIRLVPPGTINDELPVAEARDITFEFDGGEDGPRDREDQASRERATSVSASTP